ncbi:hypothetical protein Acr_07g0008330 [Actinidia rufa]|uniref:Uncharacterized protein n=1 Tax=Actinidia rufa TaxID=165716 RepID=A0A7J0EWP8_9ERIC|nr:hypothetical protein Acr_07g0008330 [Actinidia rufa]
MILPVQSGADMEVSVREAVECDGEGGGWRFCPQSFPPLAWFNPEDENSLVSIDDGNSAIANEVENWIHWGPNRQFGQLSAIQTINAYLTSHSSQISNRLDFTPNKLEEDLYIVLKQLNCPLKLDRSALRAPDPLTHNCVLAYAKTFHAMFEELEAKFGENRRVCEENEGLKNRIELQRELEAEREIGEAESVRGKILGS